MASRIQIDERKALTQVLPLAEMKVLAKAFSLERAIKQRLSQVATGRIYKRRGKYGFHQASAPGEPPAVDTGRLRASISVNWSGSGKAEGDMGSKAFVGDGVKEPSISGGEIFKAVVGTNVKYGAELEFGKKRLLPRPFMRPVFDEFKSKNRLR